MTQQGPTGKDPMQNCYYPFRYIPTQQQPRQPRNYMRNNDPFPWYHIDPTFQNYNNCPQPISQMQPNQAEGTAYNQSVKTNTGEFSPNPNPDTPTSFTSSISVNDAQIAHTGILLRDNSPCFQPLSQIPSNNRKGDNPDNNMDQIGDQHHNLAKVKVSANDNCENNQMNGKNHLPNIIIQIPGMPQCPIQWSTQCNNVRQCNNVPECIASPPACKRAKTTKDCNPLRPSIISNEPITNNCMTYNFPVFNPLQQMNPMGPQMYDPGFSGGSQFMTMNMFGATQPDSSKMYRNRSSNPQQGRAFSGEYQFMPGMENLPSGGQDFNDPQRMTGMPFYYNPLATIPFLGEVDPQQYHMLYPYGEQTPDENGAGGMYFSQEPPFMEQDGRFSMNQNNLLQNPLYQNVFQTETLELDKDNNETHETAADETASSDRNSIDMSIFMKPNDPQTAEPESLLEPRSPPETFGSAASAKRKRPSLETKDQATSRIQIATLMPNTRSFVDLNKKDPGKYIEESIQCKLPCLDDRSSEKSGMDNSSGRSSNTVPHTTHTNASGVKNKCRKCPKPSLIPKLLCNPKEELDPTIALELEMQRQQLLMQQELQNQRCTMMLQQELQNQRQTLLLQRQLQNQRQALILQQELQNREQSIQLQNELSGTVRKKSTGNNNNNNTSSRYRSRRKSWTANRTRMTPDSSGRQAIASVGGGSGNDSSVANKNQNSLRSGDADPMEIQIYNGEVTSSSNCPCPDQGNSTRPSPACTLHAEYAMKMARLKEHNRLPMLSTLPPTERNSLLTRSRKKRVPAEPTTLMVRGCRCDSITSSYLKTVSPPCEFPSITTLGLQQLKKDKCLELDKLAPPGTMSMSKVIKFQARFGMDGDEG